LLDRLPPGRKIVPTTVLFDLKNEQTIIMHYSFDKGPCPFHAGNRCSIYEDKPWMCRQFPCLHDLRQLIAGRSNQVLLLRNSLCKAEEEDRPFDDLDNASIRICELLEERYGEAFRYAVATGLMAQAKAKAIQRLEQEGFIQVARRGYDPASLARRIEKSPHVDLTDLYQRSTGIDMLKSFDLDTEIAKLKERYG